MHASGQWSALGTLLGGGKVVLYPSAHVDMARVLDLIEREQVTIAEPRRRRERAARCSTRSTPHRGAWDTSSLRLLGSGGSILSGDVKDGLMRRDPVRAAIVEGIGSSESPAQARRRHDARRRAPRRR